MNQTVVIDQHEADKRIENRLNAVLRHCKIGKVTSKRKVLINCGWYRFPGGESFPVSTGPTYMPKCGCRVGTACGNAACPHMPIATC